MFLLWSFQICYPQNLLGLRGRFVWSVGSSLASKPENITGKLTFVDSIKLNGICEIRWNQEKILGSQLMDELNLFLFKSLIKKIISQLTLY